MSLRSIARKLVVRLLPIYHKLLVWRLRHKKVINVVFFAASVSMWRYQYLYELMSKYPRFKTFIVVLPSVSYAKEQQIADNAHDARQPAGGCTGFFGFRTLVPEDKGTHQQIGHGRLPPEN